jgi:hypothetical protein
LPELPGKQSKKVRVLPGLWVQACQVFPYCGKHLPLTANFCNRCGHQLAVESAGFPVDASFPGSSRDALRAVPTLRVCDGADGAPGGSLSLARAQPPDAQMLHRYVPKELLTKLEPVRELGGMVGDRTSRCCLWASLSDKTTHPYGSLQRLTVV